MKCSTLIVISVMMGVAMMVKGTLGAEAKSCKAVVSDVTKKQMGLMTKCGKTLKFKNAKDKASKSMCIMKCVLQEVGMLNDKGSVDAESLDRVSKDFFTVETDRLNSVKAMTPCMEQHAAAMDPNEEFCKSYEPFVKCLLGGINNFCPAPA